MELRRNKNIFLIFLGVILIELVFATLNGSSTHNGGGATILLIVIAPFILYNFLYHPTKSFTYAMIPASWLEKFMSAWVMCVIFVPLLLAGFSFFVAFIGDLTIAHLTTQRPEFAPIAFLTDTYWRVIAYQAVISFWGVFWFKRQKVGKTILTFVGIILALLFIAFILYRLGFGDSEGIILIENYHFPATYLSYGLSVLLWVVSLIKFRRTQI